MEVWREVHAGDVDEDGDFRKEWKMRIIRLVRAGDTIRRCLQGSQLQEDGKPGSDERGGGLCNRARCRPFGAFFHCAVEWPSE